MLRAFYKKLQELDKEDLKIPFKGEYTISNELKRILKKYPKHRQTADELAEILAFDFIPNLKVTESYKYYYTSQYTIPQEDGSIVAYPHRSQISEKMLRYWEDRAQNARSPIMRFRYANLVIDFSPEIINQRAKPIFYEIVIESAVSIAKMKLTVPLYIKYKLHRALSLAIEIKKRIPSELVNEIIKLDKEGPINSPGLWGFAMQWLVLNKSKKVKSSIPEKLRKELLNDIRHRFENTNCSRICLEHAAYLLTQYYALEKNEKKLVKVLQEFKRRYLALVENAHPLVILDSHKKILELYQYYATQFRSVKENLKKLIIELNERERHLNWDNVFSTITIPITIPKKRLEKLIRAISDARSVKEAIAKIIAIGIPQKNRIIEHIREINSKYIFNKLAKKFILSKEGYPKAVLHPNADWENEEYSINQISEYIMLSTTVTHFLLEEFINKFPPNKLINHLMESPLFNEIDQVILERIIKHYYNKNLLEFIYTATPLIEAAVRKLVKLTHGRWLRPNNYGGYTAYTLSELLKDDLNQKIIMQVFGKRGDDILMFFNVTLIEKLGLEIRNKIAHGEAFDEEHHGLFADIVFLIILLLSLVTEKKNA